MTSEMVLTLVILAFAVALFVFEWVRVDVVGIIMMVLSKHCLLVSCDGMCRIQAGSFDYFFRIDDQGDSSVSQDGRGRNS